jgi:mannose-6-phosphate isomerase-like protein (cupin superfamily)
MLLDFTKMSETAIKNFYGGEKELLTQMYTDEHARIMKIKLVPGASVGLHKHEASSEIIFVLSGTGTAIYDGQKEKLQAGLCHYCPKGHSHTVINDSKKDLLFYAVVANQ